MEALVAIELADFCKCEKRPPETCSGSTGREPAGGRRRRSCSPASLIEKSELGEREERLRAEPWLSLF